MNNEDYHILDLTETPEKRYSGYNLSEIDQLIHDSSDVNDAILKKIFTKNQDLFDEIDGISFDWVAERDTSLKRDIEFATLAVKNNKHLYSLFSPVVRNDLVLAKIAVRRWNDNYQFVGPELRENMELFITLSELSSLYPLNSSEMSGEYSEEFVLKCFDYNPATLRLFRDFVLTEEFRDILLDHNPYLMLYTISDLVHNKKFMMKCVEASPVNSICSEGLSRPDPKMWELARKIWPGCIDYVSSEAVLNLFGMISSPHCCRWEQIHEKYKDQFNQCCEKEDRCFNCNCGLLIKTKKWMDIKNKEFEDMREIICQPEYQHVFLNILSSLTGDRAKELLVLADGSKTVSEYHASIQRILKFRSTVKSNRSMVY